MLCDYIAAWVASNGVVDGAAGVPQANRSRDPLEPTHPHVILDNYATHKRPVDTPSALRSVFCALQQLGACRLRSYSGQVGDPCYGRVGLEFYRGRPSRAK